ncbi:hypothetical protein L0P88_20015 [Muricauda sp. SCSIO 64092]|uniref:hypothetical protein n=1 Tax=Allomuricauda sp. SCSIO 64092 TaxID=2908842 RepID=UPI001FF4AF9C|nr:hypothetical protein [Muricauda sp. SCSIO 64092]UOY06198.1 hypothetical protein L0P88_20015 [Muricauda sp. SCSIO 64092]
MKRLLLIGFFLGTLWSSGQENGTNHTYRNDIAINTGYLMADQSVYLIYENAFSKNFSAGLGLWYGKYGFNSRDFDDGYGNGTKDYEITPYGRWYVRGNQRNSFFLQAFTSLHGGRSNEVRRRTTTEGYGVYRREIENYTNLALGVGIGQKFLLFKKRISLELMLGLGGDIVGEYYDDFGVSVAQSGINLGFRF